MNDYTVNLRGPAGDVAIRIKAQSEEHARVIASACMDERERIETVVPDPIHATH